MTLREQMIEAMILRGFSAGTQTTYLSSVGKLARHFAKSPADLKTEDIKQYWRLLSQRLQSTTLGTDHAALRFLFEHVLKRPWVLKDIPAPKRNSPVPVLLSRREVQRLIAAARNVRARAIMMLMYGAGLRVSEAIRLRVPDIDSERRLIHVQRSKNRQSRCVMLGDELLTALRTWWKARDDAFGTELMFPGCREHTTFTTAGVRKLVSRTAKRAGIQKRVHPHMLRSLQESIDTTTAGGKLVFHVFAALAEFERDIIVERTQAGLAAARARGRHGGRPKAMDASKASIARQMYETKEHTVTEIANTLGVSRATVYRCLGSQP